MDGAAVARSALIPGLLLAGCLHVPAYAPQRAVAIWRTMQPAPTGATGPGGAATAGDALDAGQTCALALANNADLAAVAARSAVAAADVRAAREIEGPQLRLTNFNVDDVVDGRAGVNLGVRMPIPRPGAVRARVAGARFAADDQRTATDEAGRRLCTRIHKLFARLALLHADREHVARAAAMRAADRARQDDRLARAVATHLDVALADVALAEARDEDARVLGEILRSEAELVRLVGVAGPAALPRRPRRAAAPTISPPTATR
jgi:outer membrane protein TolC